MLFRRYLSYRHKSKLHHKLTIIICDLWSPLDHNIRGKYNSSTCKGIETFQLYCPWCTFRASWVWIKSYLLKNPPIMTNMIQLYHLDVSRFSFFNILLFTVLRSSIPPKMKSQLLILRKLACLSTSETWRNLRIQLHSSLGLRGFHLRENEVTRFLFGGTIPRFTRTWFTRMDLLTEKVARIK